jgi:hypothetical protein
MNDDMEVRCAALRMEYQKRMVRSNFTGIVLIFWVRTYIRNVSRQKMSRYFYTFIKVLASFCIIEVEMLFLFFSIAE